MYQKIPSLTNWRDPRYHAIRRKPWDRAFSRAALKKYHPLILKHVDQVSKSLSRRKGDVDLVQWLSFFTYANMVFLASGVYPVALSGATS